MKLIDHVLKIRGLIQQAIDNRFSRLGLQEEAMPVETLSDGLLRLIIKSR